MVSEVLRRSHFLVLPTRADCTPHVVSEANAFGVPALSTRVGGLPGLVVEGENGHLVDLSDRRATADAVTVILERYHRNADAYHAITSSSYSHYQRRLNWDVAGQRAHELLKRAAGLQLPTSLGGTSLH